MGGHLPQPVRLSGKAERETRATTRRQTKNENRRIMSNCKLKKRKRETHGKEKSKSFYTRHVKSGDQKDNVKKQKCHQPNAKNQQ